MSFDFTVAITPSMTNIDRELQYIKSALLYADQVTLISPMAYLYTQLSMNGSKLDEKALIRLLNFILPMCREKSPETFRQGQEVVGQLSSIILSKRYKAIPMIHKIEMRKMLAGFSQELDTTLLKMVGDTQANELKGLIQSKKLILKKFEHSLADVDGCVSEYFGMLKASVRSSFPLFDEMSNDLMVAAVKSRIICLSDTDRRKITHAGVSDNFIHRLPSFEEASLDEILDIRQELNGPLIRFRGKMLDYSDSVQFLPWDEDFEEECSLLFEKEVAPAMLEIDELTKENGFIKNLSKSLITDGEFLKSTGGLVVGMAAAGVISSFSQAISTDTAILTAGGAWATQKIAMTYEEYSKQKKAISKKDLFFYYQAGKLLNK